MGKPLVKSISFKEIYKEQYNFLMEQDNPSQFVCELIKDYMRNGDDFESRVKEVLIKYLSNQQQTVYQPTTFNTQNIPSTVNGNQDKIDEIEDIW